MRRRTFDALAAAVGVLLALVLAVAGGLLLWAHGFIDDQVHSQLADQKIFFPPAGSQALADPQIKPYLSKYAGQQLLDGAQAEAWANHFIAVHLQKIGGGQTYSQLSAKAQADPSDTQLATQVQTMFRGETLRGLLLNAYAFWKMAQVALYAAVVAFVAAGLLLVLAVLGLWHLRRTDPEREFLGRRIPPTPAVVADN